MKSKVEFMSHGVKLSGLLERPSGSVKAYALFAHCFTCGKDIAAASRISRSLVQKGIAVLRFDFTGLGNSDGDFANSNFSSNLHDLVAAANYLREYHEAPELLIGHSLGGSAVIAMANEVPESKAVVTIGAPATADHVKHNFAASLGKIEREGLAKVKLGHRKFTIKQQFLVDLAYHSQQRFTLNQKALLVMHSPVDTTVSIDEAEKIYHWAKHPKSFVSLDRADHLLSQKADSEYVANTIVGWVSKYVGLGPEATNLAFVSQGSVAVEEKDRKFTQHVISDSHYWLADEPLAVGGSNLGPDPYEHLLAALGACTAMTLRMYADQKQLPLDKVKVTLTHNKNHADDCKNVDAENSYTDRITRIIEMRGVLTQEQSERLIEIANKCPVHKTLHGQTVVETRLA